jgi:hypothetical protein
MWRIEMKKTVMIAIFILLCSGIAWATDVLVSDIKIEAGDPFPIPYSCISYHNRNDKTLELWYKGCEGKVDHENYFPVFPGPDGGIMAKFEFNGEELILKFVGFGKNQALLYRRIP